MLIEKKSILIINIIFMLSQEKVLDRIEQSFELFKSNFKVFFMPLFIYWIIATIFTVIGTYFLVSKFQEILDSETIDWMGFYDIFYNPQSMILISVAILLLLLYLILYIPFLLWLLKSISQAYNWEKADCKENLKYWFSHLMDSMKTYWYIFAYVALIPSILFIVGWILIIYWIQFDTAKIIVQLGFFIVWISVILFLFFALYRWTKSAFWLQSAVDSNNYSLENFKQSVIITKNKFWRILWNFMLVGFIGWLVVWMIMWVIDSFGSSFWMWAETFFANIWQDSDNPWEQIQQALKETLDSYSPIANIITNTLQWAVKTTFSIFLIVFTYILFKRLEIENNEINNSEVTNNDETIKL